MAIELINPNTKVMNAAAVQLMLIASMHTHGRYFDCGYTLRGKSESLIEARVWNRLGRNFSESDTKKIEDLAGVFGTAVETKAAELGIVIYEQENLKNPSPLEPTEMLSQFNFVLRELAKDLCTEVKIIACQPNLEDAGRLNSNKLAVTSIVLIEFDDHKFVAPMTNSWVYGNYESVPQEYKDRILISYNEGLNPVDESHSDIGEIYRSINSYVMQTLDLICRHKAIELTKKQ